MKFFMLEKSEEIHHLALKLFEYLSDDKETNVEWYIATSFLFEKLNTKLKNNYEYYNDRVLLIEKMYTSAVNSEFDLDKYDDVLKRLKLDVVKGKLPAQSLGNSELQKTIRFEHGECDDAVYIQEKWEEEKVREMQAMMFSGVRHYEDNHYEFIDSIEVISGVKLIKSSIHAEDSLWGVSPLCQDCCRLN